MKKLFMLILMTVACCTVQAQNVVTVKDASNMTAKELKQAAKEQKKKENAIKAEVKAKAAVLRHRRSIKQHKRQLKRQPRKQNKLRRLLRKLLIKPRVLVKLTRRHRINMPMLLRS